MPIRIVSVHSSRGRSLRVSRKVDSPGYRVESLVRKDRGVDLSRKCFARSNHFFAGDETHGSDVCDRFIASSRGGGVAVIGADCVCRVCV